MNDDALPAPLSHLAPFDVAELVVWEGVDWVVTVRRRQVTLGAMSLLPRIPYSNFSEVPAEAAAELFRLLARAEKAVLLLGAERVNVVAMMMAIRFLHFHLFPRYSAAISRFGREWVDEDWPAPVTLRPAQTDDDVLAAIRDELRDVLWES